MSRHPALWNGNFRKEAMDLICTLWRDLDDAGRTYLGDAILAGPPDEMLAHLDYAERLTSRDRRIFDRLAVVERVKNPPLTPVLQQRMDELRATYSDWRMPEGERGHFGIWTEVGNGPNTRYSVEDLSAMVDEALIEALRTDMEQREDLLEAWRKLFIKEPKRGFNLLEQLGLSGNPGPADAWEYGLWGMRDANDAGSATDRMIKLLNQVPAALFENPDVVRGAAQLLEVKSRSLHDGGEPDGFWELFDRTVLAAGDEVSNEEPSAAPGYRDWVDEAINLPLGQIATAFVNALFARRPKVGAGLPDDLINHANLLMSPGQERHRFARTVGASRLSYLFAIDPEWTTKALLPSFGWVNEDESIAMWQGYSWQARIDPQLWPALKEHFLQLFRPERLARLGSWGRNISQILMLVGVTFGDEELKRDDVREAIRSMPEEMRQDAADWISGYMEVGGAEDASDERQIAGSPDGRWTDHIWPWIKRVWPTEPSLRSAGVAEQFALAAIATDKAFPYAVDGIANYAFKSRGYEILRELNASAHPTNHPEATLKLLDAFVEKETAILIDEDLLQIVECLNRHVVLRDDNRFLSWSEYVAQRQR